MSTDRSPSDSSSQRPGVSGSPVPPASGPASGSTVTGRAAGSSVNHAKIGSDSQRSPGVDLAKEFPFLKLEGGPDGMGMIRHYRIRRMLGKGAVGVVFAAEDTELGREVAIKVMRPQHASNAEARLRFLREGRAAAALRNDHIVTVFQVGEEHGLPFLVMELLRGMTLEQWLQAGRPVRVPQALRVARETALGLAAAHDAGMVHRDIKPDNLWLEAPGGRIKILDFGLARLDSGGTALTQTGQVIGTPHYMAPEQARGVTVDGRSDLYSLGCVLYRLLVGHPPFPGENLMDVVTAQIIHIPRPIQELAKDVPGPVASVVERLLAKRPEDRIPSARHLVAVITKLEQLIAVATTQSSQTIRPLSHESASVKAVATATEPSNDPAAQAGGTSSSPSRRTPTWLLALVGLIAAGAVTALAWMFITQSNNPSERPSVGMPTVAGAIGMVAASVSASGSPSATSSPPAPSLDLSRFPVEQRAAYIADRLKAVNLNFDGLFKQATEAGEVVRFECVADHLLDIKPLQGLKNLRSLSLAGSGPRASELSDLTPLAQLRDLEELDCSNTKVADLSPLRGLPLKRLNLQGTPVRDLAPLQGAPLTMIDLRRTRVANLSPLRDAPITVLGVGPGKADEPTNLATLHDLRLKVLKLTGIRFSSYEPLLTQVELESVEWDPLEVSNEQKAEVAKLVKVLEQLPNLKEINGKPAELFLSNSR